MPRWSVPPQIYFLAERFKAQVEIARARCRSSGTARSTRTRKRFSPRAAPRRGLDDARSITSELHLVVRRHGGFSPARRHPALKASPESLWDGSRSMTAMIRANQIGDRHPSAEAERRVRRPAWMVRRARVHGSDGDRHRRGAAAGRDPGVPQTRRGPQAPPPRQNRTCRSTWADAPAVDEREKEEPRVLDHRTRGSSFRISSAAQRPVP